MRSALNIVPLQAPVLPHIPSCRPSKDERMERGLQALADRRNNAHAELLQDLRQTPVKQELFAHSLAIWLSASQIVVRHHYLKGPRERGTLPWLLIDVIICEDRGWPTWSHI